MGYWAGVYWPRGPGYTYALEVDAQPVCLILLGYQEPFYLQGEKVLDALTAISVEEIVLIHIYSSIPRLK